RRAVFQHELGRSLAVADCVVLASVYRPEAIAEHDRLNTAAVIAQVPSSGHQASELPEGRAIVSEIPPQLRSRDVVAILATGGFGGIYEKLPRRLRELHAGKSPVETRLASSPTGKR